jgi:glutamate formiminotransferase
MALIAVPNVSEGRDEVLIAELERAVSDSGARALDVHSDADHNRTVLTVFGSEDRLVDALVSLAGAARAIDISSQPGVHPRLGSLDVCPVVPHGSPMSEAVGVAVEVGRLIWDRARLPVYLYGEAARRPETRELPDLRRGGLATLASRAVHDLPPDFGGPHLDPTNGVVCVGARDVLIAFNVNVSGDEADARALAADVRNQLGREGVRALGLWLPRRAVAQVSMNLTQPHRAGIEDAFGVVRAHAESRGVAIVETEIVGLVPERYRPKDDASAARLLLRPGRTLESVIAND